MVEYDEEYYRTHDIDYFLTFRGDSLHIASNGSILPNMIEGSKNREVKLSIYDALNSGGFVEREVDVNRNAIIEILKEEGYKEVKEDDIENYAESFVEFAKMGFQSYDTIGSELIQICKPRRERKEGGYTMIQNIPSVPDDYYEIKEEENYGGFSVLSTRQ